MIIKRKAPVRNNDDVFLVTDIGGFAARCGETEQQHIDRQRLGSNWTGNKSWDLSLSQVRDGDLSGVAQSDKYMDAIETQGFVSLAWQETMDVVGGIANVPAYLAGYPLTMRRMERVANERGPLAVFCSLELSADIKVDTMRKRGAAVLALVRALSALRPVELFACCSIGESGWASHALIKIDTAPLDLARAAHVLTCPSVTRGLCYAMLADLGNKELGKSGWNGHWAYGNHEAYRRTVRDNFISVASPSAEALLLPAAHSSDPCVKEPIAWLNKMIVEYGGLTDE